jgi:hypothetical protein
MILYKSGPLKFHPDLIVGAQLKSFSKNIYEKIQKRGVDQCDKYLEKEATDHQPVKEVPGKYAENAQQTNHQEGVY